MRHNPDLTPVLIQTKHQQPLTGELRDAIELEIAKGREVVVYSGEGFEPNALRVGVRMFKRFLYLKESSRILDPLFWKVIDRTPAGAFLFSRPSCYMAVYDSQGLSTILDQIPRNLDKEGSIWWEWNLQGLLDYRVIYPDVTDKTAKRIELVDGEPELVIGNDLIEKYKGTARCPRCSHLKGTGLCSHYLTRFAA